MMIFILATNGLGQRPYGFQAINQRRWKSHLYVARRPLRKASIEKKREERKAMIEKRQNETIHDPTLLTSQLFSECREIHPNSKRALEDMGLQSMTEVQARVFASALEGEDVVARARTGA